MVVLFLGLALVVVAIVSAETTIALGLARRSRCDDFLARQIAESAAHEALALLRDGGHAAPRSGGTAAPRWVAFSAGELLYYTVDDAQNSVSTVRAWGRVATTRYAARSEVAPDAATFDGAGWVVRGIELTVRGVPLVPDSPVYVGNGGLERPMGGAVWAADMAVSDRNTWGFVSSSPASYQSGLCPFEISALDHPVDYLYDGGSPAPALTKPHPTAVWTSQNPVAEAGVEAWFRYSAGAAGDPRSRISPPPGDGYYDERDRRSPGFPYSIDPTVPDVQSYADDLWNRHRDDPSAVHLNSGEHSGEHGTLDHPRITFVTGPLSVESGQTLRGCGILVVRDAYNPVSNDQNTPSLRARFAVEGTFEWTGLVIVSGWAPDIVVSSGGRATIVGALFAEDSVQSGGEPSLESATTVLRVEDSFRILYSSGVFRAGGLVHHLLPPVRKEVVGVREL